MNILDKLKELVFKREKSGYQIPVDIENGDELTRLLRVLGLNSDANAGQIKSRYRDLVKEYHPDKHREQDEQSRVDEFQKVHKAYKRIMEIKKGGFSYEP